MLKFSSLVALLLLIAPGVAAAKDAAPPDAVAKQCEGQAKADAGAPAASPRSQPNASPPSDDTLQRERSDGPAPRRATPNPTQQDIEAKTPIMPSASPADNYRMAYEACLRARGY